MKKLLRSLLDFTMIELSYFRASLLYKNKSKIQEPLNLCSGSINPAGFLNLDFSHQADVRIDLNRHALPFKESSVPGIILMSAINYFDYNRAEEILKDCFRVLQQDGIIRIGIQDIDLLIKKYMANDTEFFEQKLSSGKDRFPGRTLTDRLVNFFYGFSSGNNNCKYIYSFESLKSLVESSGFTNVTRCDFKESKNSSGLEVLDNRPEQMFYLEARKTKR